MNNQTFPMLDQLNRKQLLDLHQRVEDELKKFRVEEAEGISLQIQAQVGEHFPTFLVEPIGVDGFELTFLKDEVNTHRWGYSQVQMILSDIFEMIILDSYFVDDGTWRVVF